MAKDDMRYDRMVETALRSVVREALILAAKEGLPGDHHFYITFRTTHPGVELAEYLRERYPTEMTVVLQHQFYGLEVEEDRFRVTLSFNNVPEQLDIPYAAISIFADPSVNFALQFQPSESGDLLIEDDEALGEDAPVEATPLQFLDEADEDDTAPPEGGGEVVSLDQFRRK